MKKLHKFLIMTVLVSMLVGLGAIVSSADATVEPSRTLANFVGDESTGTSMASGSISALSKGENKFFSIDFTANGANANFGSGNQDFLGKGDYVITEFDFMAEDWTTMSNILIGWNSRNSGGGALNDMHFSFSNVNGVPKITGNPLTGSITLDSTPGV